MTFKRGSINNKVIKEIAEGNKTVVSIVDNNGDIIYEKDVTEPAPPSKIDTQIIVNGTSLFLTTLEGVGIDDQVVEVVSKASGAMGVYTSIDGGRFAPVSKVASATYYGDNIYNGCTWSA